MALRLASSHRGGGLATSRLAPARRDNYAHAKNIGEPFSLGKWLPFVLPRPGRVARGGGGRAGLTRRPGAVYQPRRRERKKAATPRAELSSSRAEGSGVPAEGTTIWPPTLTFCELGVPTFSDCMILLPPSS